MSAVLRVRPVVLAVLTVVVALLSGCSFKGAYDLPLPGGPVNDDNSFEVTAEFADILDVVPKSPVQVNDVTVGEVTDVERVGWHAQVTMRIRNDIVLPDNAVAEIRQVSLLGEKYVDLEQPVGQAPQGRLGDGDDIPLSSTGRNPEVEEVLGALSYLLSGGGVAQLGTITHELNQAMDGRTDQLRDLFNQLNGVIGTLDGQKSDIIRALASLDSLTSTLNKEKGVITGALDATGPAITVLADQEKKLVGMLSSLDRLGVVGTRVIRASKDDLLGQLRSLRPVLEGLNKSGKSLAPGLNLLVSFPFPKEASEIVQGDYANTSIFANVDLSSLTPNIGTTQQVKGPLSPHGLTQLQKCLTSGSLQSRACKAVLGSLSLLTHLISACQHGHPHSSVCQAVGLLGNGNGNGNGNGGGLGLPGVPGIPGIGGLTSGLTSGQPSGRTDTHALLGGGS